MNKTDILAQILKALAADREIGHLGLDDAGSAEPLVLAGQSVRCLADGQRRRVADIERTLALWGALDLKPRNRVELGALVVLDSPQGVRRVFLGPVAVCVKVQSWGIDILVIAPDSPMALALQGLGEGEGALVPVADRLQYFEVLAVY